MCSHIWRQLLTAGEACQDLQLLAGESTHIACIGHAARHVAICRGNLHQHSD